VAEIDKPMAAGFSAFMVTIFGKLTMSPTTYWLHVWLLYVKSILTDRRLFFGLPLTVNALIYDSEVY